ncbi:MAG: hypothetical protein AB1333_02750 [Patescibacteria group bacterium]
MKQEQSSLMQKEWSVINLKRGFISIEALLAATIFGLLVTGLVGAYLYGQESTALSGSRVRATILAEEGLEVVRNIRDASYVNLVDGTYGLATSSNQWIFSGSQDTIGGFTRQITIATVDAKRKLITSNVSWQQNQQRSGSVSLVSRLTNWMAIVIGNWANPNTLVGTYDASGTNDGLKIAVQGNYAYIVRNGGTPDFIVVDISTPSLPSLAGSLTLPGTPNNIFVLGNYAYVTNNDNAQELQIIDISNPVSPSVVGTYNAPGNGNGVGIYVVGSTAYLGRDTGGGDTFIVIDVSNPGTPSLIGSLSLGQTEYEIVISGNYAYLASGDNAQELEIIDISVPSAPVNLSGLNFAGNTNATTIALASSTLLVGQGSSLRIVDISTPTSPLLVASFTGGAVINDISMGNGNAYAFLAESNGPSELEIVDISIPSVPIQVGVYNGATFNGVAYDEISDRAYCVGITDNAELSVIAP